MSEQPTNGVKGHDAIMHAFAQKVLAVAKASLDLLVLTSTHSLLQLQWAG